MKISMRLFIELIEVLAHLSSMSDNISPSDPRRRAYSLLCKLRELEGGDN